MMGRSNVGKSTFINRIADRQGLAKTSGQPGKTREFNLYNLEVSIPEHSSSTLLTLVDLPGFGYAKFSKKQRTQVSKSLVNFVLTRNSLKVVCLLNDCRRNPQEDEYAIRSLAFERNIHLLVILTKIDKLNQKEKSARLKKLSDAYGLEKEDFILTGSKSQGTELWERVLPLLT